MTLIPPRSGYLQVKNPQEIWKSLNMYRRPNDSCTTDYLSSSSERRGNVKHRLEICFSLYIGNQEPR